ncbi:MAG: YfhO family protein, partial [Thermoanaerobaculia bacterium]
LSMLPWREAVRRAIRSGEWPLLNRYEQCGDDLAGSAQAVFSPLTAPGLLLPTALSFTWSAAIGFFIAGLSAFLLARSLECSITASLIAAIGFMFAAATTMLILLPMAISWALLPLILVTTRMVVRAPSFRNALILTIVLALEVLAGHPESTLHVAAIGAAFGVFELVRASRRIAAIVAAACAGVVALLLTAVALMPMLDAMHQSGEWIVRTWYAAGPLRIAKGFTEAAALSDLFPFVRGQYQFLLPRAEAGSIVLALAICAVATVRKREVWFFAGLAVIAFLIGIDAWPFVQILHALPVFDRALNDRVVSAVPLALAMLAAFAIDAAPSRRIMNVGIVLMLIIGFAGAWFRESGRVDIARLVAETIPLGVAALVIGFVRREIACGLVVALLLVQRIIGDASLLPAYEERAAFPPIPILQPLARIADPFRIVAKGSMLLPNTATMYGLEDVRAATPITLASYAETFPLWLERRGFGEVNDIASPMLSMMNVRFAIVHRDDAVPAGWRIVTEDRSSRLVENPNALPRAFIPRLIRFGRTDQQEIAEMKEQRDFAERAWIAGLRPGEAENAKGRVVAHHAPLGLRLDAEMEREGYVVVSNTAWHGWRAYVDGRAVRPLRANHSFLGVFVPAGRHVIQLKYLPQAFVAGRAVSVASVLVLVVASVVLWRRKLKIET